MNKAIMIESKKKVFQLVTVMLLALLLLVTFMVIRNAFAVEGWQLSINYVDEDNANSVLWATEYYEDKTVTIYVNYSNNSVEHSYEPGELIITIPGIDDAQIGYNQEPSIGANKVGSSTADRAWTYSYNSLTNMYTFINNKAISSGTSINGFFEMTWYFTSIKTKNNYSSSIKAHLIGSEKEEGSGSLNLESNTLTFATSFVRSPYTLNEDASPVYKNQMGTLNMDNYIVVKYSLSSGVQNKSNRINGDVYYELNLPSGAILTDLPVSLSVGNNDEIISLGSNKYRLSYNSALTTSNQRDVFIAYPKATYSGQTINNAVSLYGTYNGDIEESLLASTTISVNLNNFDYKETNLDKYSFIKKSYGKYNSHIDSVCSTNLYLSGQSLTNTTFKSTIGGDLNATFNDKFSYEVTDDFLYIKKSNGDFRPLTNAEYSFKQMWIGAANTFTDSNGIPLPENVYNVEIYANGTLFKTFKLGSDQSIYFPDGVHKISVKLVNLDRTIKNFHFDLDTKLSITNLSDIDVDNSAIYNSSFVKVYNESGTWLNNSTSVSDYDNSANINFGEKDISTYGNYLERTSSIVHIHKYVYTPPPSGGTITNYFYNMTSLSYFNEVEGGWSILASIGTQSDIESGGIYTLLPKGLKLPDGYQNIDDIWNYVSVGSGTSAEYLQTIVPTVIENYNGTGRTYIGFEFSTGFSTILYINLRLSSYDYQLYGADYTLKSYSFTSDPTALITMGLETDTEDMNRNGNIVENTSSKSASATVHFAKSAESQIQKSVRTTSTNGKFSTNNAKVNFGSSYTYRLSAEMGNSNAKNIVIIDNLENESSEWQGIFESVDTTFAEAMGFSPVVYYSNATNNTGWSTTKGTNTKAIKVDFGSNELEVLDGIYVLVNMKAPNDTNLTGKISNNKYSISYTSVDPTTKVETNMELTSNEVSLELAKLGDLKVNKIDNQFGKIVGAKFNLYKEDGTLIKANIITNLGGFILIKNLDYGNYYLVETSVPNGYILDDTHHTFTINSDYKEIDVVNKRKTGNFKLVKKNNLNSDGRVSGAIYTLYKKSDDSVVQTYTTDTNGQITFDVPWGEEYYLKETVAPDGFNINNEVFDISFTYENVLSGRVYISKVTTNEQKSGGVVTLTKYELSEDGSTKLNGIIPGVVYDLYYYNHLVGTYVADENGQIKVGNLAIGSYFFLEHSEATGYIKSTDHINFNITASDLENSVQVKGYNQRKYGRLRVYKTDENNNALQDAVFNLYKLKEGTSDYEKVGEFTTDVAGQINIENMLWGKYYLQEIKSPLGYALDSRKYEFTIDSSNAGSRITIDAVNAQSSGNVTLTKYNTDGSLKLANAEYSLYKNDGTLVKSGLKTDATGKISVTNLGWGTFYFLETKAPTGYSLSSEKIRFSINNITAGTTQEVSAYDNNDTSKNITVYKKIKISDINFEHGNPTFLFEVSAATESGLKTKRQQVTITEDYLYNYKADHPTEQYLEISTIFTGLQGDQTYTVDELSTIRYEVNSIEQSSGTNDGNSKSTLPSLTTDDYVRFINEKEKNSDLSHTSLVTNSISTRKFTSLSVIYAKDGEAVTGGTVIDRDDLQVYATYDDGTTRLLTNADYTLDLAGDKVPDEQKSDLTVTASYIEDGITRTGSFVVTVEYISQLGSCSKNSLAYKIDSSNLGEGASIDYDTDPDQAFIKGELSSNYVWYSGKLWRAISIDPSDCSVKLLLLEGVTSIPFNSTNDSTFANSLIDQWLKEVFEPTLYNSNSIVASKDFNFTEDNQNIWSGIPVKPANTTLVNRKVGLLNIYEYLMLDNAYMGWNTYNHYWLGTPFNSNELRNGGKNAQEHAATEMSTVIPVINISGSATVANGTGSKTNPYKITGDISTPLAGSLLNSRVSGEYVNFDGKLFRIVGVEGGLTKITSYDFLYGGLTDTIGSDSIYNPSSSTSTVANSLNNTSTDYYQTLNGTYKNMIVNGTWHLGDLTGNDWHHTTDTSASCNWAGICTSTGMIGIPRIGEMWTAMNVFEGTKQLATLTPYNNTKVVVTGSLWDMSGGGYIFGSMYLANNVKITSGLGTKDSPFELTQ